MNQVSYINLILGSRGFSEVMCITLLSSLVAARKMNLVWFPLTCLLNLLLPDEKNKICRLAQANTLP